jgi:pyruvate/2-oxoglutarate dehydrogenase complex dihydrolipoamide acyltransferase (E2) component
LAATKRFVTAIWEFGAYRINQKDAKTARYEEIVLSMLNAMGINREVGSNQLSTQSVTKLSKAPRQVASPAARKLARDLGIDLNQGYDEL